jgi:hypothetical protein
MNETSILSDKRRHTRIDERAKVLWQVKGSGDRGKGTVKNISVSGMLMETDKAFQPNQDSYFLFESLLGKDNFIPVKGRLVWQRSIPKRSANLCGVEFLETSEQVVNRLRTRIEGNLTRASRSRTLNTFAGVLLVLSMTSLLGFILWQGSDIYTKRVEVTDRLSEVSDQQAILTQSYANRYHAVQLQLISTTEELNATKQLYQDSQVMLDSVNLELVETRAVLAEAEKMIMELGGESSILKGKINSIGELTKENINAFKSNLSAAIADLELKNKTLSEELGVLEAKISYYEGNVKDIDDGKKWIEFYRGKLGIVKTKIRDFRHEAEKIRVSAQKEKDRIRLLLGNNGYFMKNGAAVKVDAEKYNAAMMTPEIEEKLKDSSSRNVEVNVDFVK